MAVGDVHCGASLISFYSLPLDVLQQTGWRLQEVYLESLDYSDFLLALSKRPLLASVHMRAPSQSDAPMGRDPLHCRYDYPQSLFSPSSHSRLQTQLLDSHRPRPVYSPPRTDWLQSR